MAQQEEMKNKFIVLGFATGLLAAEIICGLAEAPVGKLKALDQKKWIFPIVAVVLTPIGVYIQIQSFISKARAAGAVWRRCWFFTIEVNRSPRKIWANKFDLMGIIFWFVHFGLVIFDLVMKAKHKEVGSMGLLSIYPGIAAGLEVIHASLSLCNCFQRPYIVRYANDVRRVVPHSHHGGYVEIIMDHITLGR
ncbi:OLC1v1029724C1 [Oldenlandia corymbosa var. corymbosa]|uniref:OLC1v1029724C1 n=1 Tax=Oldenlandia corymbosa var. corymbosa TaxID=529605 RepID=A0AAV1CFY8_OLDCO|nr:OLC1v1029724C1 [Oldenlandia corymbosa var. corymbosa]